MENENKVEDQESQTNCLTKHIFFRLFYECQIVKPMKKSRFDNL